MWIGLRGILFACLLVPSLCHGQFTNDDTYSENPSFHEDTARISQLILQAKSLRHRATDSAIALFQKAVLQSQQLSYNDGIARGIIGIGLSYMDKGEYNRSLAYYQLAEPFCEASNFGGGILLVGLYNNIAALYGNRGVSDSAAQYYYKSLAEMERRQIKDTNLLILIYSNLGGRLASDNRTSQAKFYLEKGRALAEKTGNLRMLAKIYVSMGALHGALKENKEARSYAFAALKIFGSTRDPASEASANCLIAQSFLHEQQPHRAIGYYKMALSERVNASQTQQSVALRGLGASYYALNDYYRAEECYLNVLGIARQENLNKGMLDAYKSLVGVYTALGNYKLALKYRNAYEALDDSTTTAERTERINQLEVMYRTSEKDKELTQKQLLIHQKEVQLQEKNMLLLSILGGIIIFGGLLGMLLRNRKHAQSIIQIRLDKERQLARLRAHMDGEEKERARIARELHDGIMVQFSSAQMNLSALIEKSNLTQSKEMEGILVQLEEATKELRKSAHNLMPDILLQEGLAHAAHYFCRALQRSAGTEIEFQLIGHLPSMDAEYELMLYRMIQELLNNAIKHASASFVLVQINCLPNLLSLLVEDNGKGFNQERVPTRGMGLKGIETRVLSLEGTFTASNNKEGGASVYIEIETSHFRQKNKKSDAYQSSYN